VSPQALLERLGRYATGASRDVRDAAELAAGEALVAAVVAVWRRRGWVVVATEDGLRLARHPLLLGRRRTRRFGWGALTAVDSGPQRVTLTFAGEEVSLLAASPHGEFVRLLELARRTLSGEAHPTVAELRELARLKLGRTLAFGFEATIDALPDRLQPGERVERLAGASLDFAGLLVLTDRRLLLSLASLRRAGAREWAVPREDVRGAQPVGDGLRLLLAHGEDVTLTEFLPRDRRDELAAVLQPRPQG
jgi:hypothetical protein